MTPRAAESVPVGTILRDTYELLSVLGKGAMGTVYLARHLRLPARHVAVKVLHAHERLTPTQYARFCREAKISSRIRHPHIVEVLDFHDREEGVPFLVMEHLEGEPLTHRLRRGRLPVDEALSIARQMGSALHAAHEVGIIHRDLKPDNVYLLRDAEDSGPRVKLLDFGISKIVSSQSIQTRDDVLLGTPRYMSPEQAQGLNSTVDARSDLFSLGSIVYEMLAGATPFGGDVVTDILYRIVYDAPKPLAQLRPELPAHVCEAVERALAKKPDQRFPDVASFITQLTGNAPTSTARIARPPQVDASVQTISEVQTLDLTYQELPPPPPTSAVKQAAIGAGIALLLAAGAIGGWLLLRHEPEPLPAVTVDAAPPVTPATPAPVTPPPTPSLGVAAPQVVPPAEPTPAPVPTPPAPVVKRPPPRSAAPETLPETVREDLEEARRALEADDANKALKLAQRSQRRQPTSTGYTLLTQTYCHLGDLGRAKAQFFRVPPSEQGRVRQYCKRYDVSL